MRRKNEKNQSIPMRTTLIRLFTENKLWELASFYGAKDFFLQLFTFEI